MASTLRESGLKRHEFQRKLQDLSPLNACTESGEYEMGNTEVIVNTRRMDRVVSDDGKVGSECEGVC